MVREIHAKNLADLSNRDRYYLEKAIEHSSKRYKTVCDKTTSIEISAGDSTRCRNNRKRRCSIACILIENGDSRRMVTGSNSYVKTHPLQKRYSILSGKPEGRAFLHAEIHAISRASKPYAIYIARTDRQGTPQLAKPCESCRKAIEDSGIRRIVYT